MKPKSKIILIHGNTVSNSGPSDNLKTFGDGRETDFFVYLFVCLIVYLKHRLCVDFMMLLPPSDKSNLQKYPHHQLDGKCCNFLHFH